jgi:hypothetical protein
MYIDQLARLAGARSTSTRHLSNDPLLLARFLKPEHPVTLVGLTVNADTYKHEPYRLPKVDLAPMLLSNQWQG